MKKIKLYLKIVIVSLCFNHSIFCNSQDFNFWLDTKNTIKPKIDTISLKYFKKAISNGIQSVERPWPNTNNIDSIKNVYETKEKLNEIRMDSIVKSLSKKLSNSFYHTDTTLVLFGVDSTIMVNKRSIYGDQEGTNFKIVDFKNGYLVIYQIGYEWWNYILFNPKTRNFQTILDEPYFINNEIIYSSGNYYGEGQFQLKGLKDKNIYFGLFCSWEIKECYRVKNVFYLFFSKGGWSKEKIFMKIDFQQIFSHADIKSHWL